MAKAKTGKGKGKTKGPSGASATVEKHEPIPEVADAESAFLSGDYNAVRRIAAADNDLPADAKARIDELYQKTRPDPRTWAVGVGALVVALIVAIVTLGG